MMKHLQILLAAGCLGVLGAATLPNARADQWDKATVLTFSAPTELPGVVLPAGTYTFRLMDTLADRSIVQVWNGDRTKLYATLLAVPDYRLEPTDKTVVTFEERAKGSPEAVRAWFYPGDIYGMEFVYPKSKAVKLAQTNRQRVPAMPESMAKASTSKQLKQAPVTAIQPSGNEVKLAEVHNTPPPAQAAALKPAPVQTALATQKELPKTASQLPLVGLIGLLSLGGAIALRHLSAKISGDGMHS